MEKIYRPAIEYNIIEHCNLKCAFCDHASHIATRKKMITPEQFEKDLGILAKVLHVNELKILGGEPLLHPQLLELLRIARESRIAEQIILITNGLLLDIIPEAIFQAIDGMWISVYPSTMFRLKSKKLQDLADKHNFWIWKKWTPFFVRNQLSRKINDDFMVRLIYKNCSYVNYYGCNTAYDGRFYKCPQSLFMEQRLANVGIDFHNTESDSIAITDSPGLRDELNHFLTGTEPLLACAYCLGSIGRYIRHRRAKNPGRKAVLYPEKNSDLVNQYMILPSSYRKKLD